MMALRGLQTADQIIKSVLLRMGDTDLVKYQNAVDYFIDIYRDTNLFHANQTKDVPIDVSPLGVIPLPDDYVDYVKIGTNIGGGFFTFTREDGIIKLNTDPLGVNALTDLGEGQAIQRGYNYSKAVGGFNDRGYFAVDLANRRILIRNFPDTITQVILRYVCTGITDLESTLVDPGAINFIKAELEYKLSMRDPDITNGQRALLKQTCTEEMNKLFARELPTLDEWIDAVYETSGRGSRRW